MDGRLIAAISHFAALVFGLLGPFSCLYRLHCGVKTFAFTRFQSTPRNIIGCLTRRKGDTGNLPDNFDDLPG